MEFSFEGSFLALGKQTAANQRMIVLLLKSGMINCSHRAPGDWSTAQMLEKMSTYYRGR
jgi:hypothetical protein